MSKLLELQMERLDELLDLLDGSDHLSRDSSPAATSGPGQAGYEPCLSCADNHARGWKVCPSCNGSKWTHSGGEYDPYMIDRERVDSVSSRAVSSESPIKSGVITPENRESVMAGVKLSAQQVVRELPVRVQMTSVERSANLTFRPGVHRSLVWLKRKLAEAPGWVRSGASSRDHAALEWLARRAPGLETPSGL